MSRWTKDVLAALCEHEDRNQVVRGFLKMEVVRGVWPPPLPPPPLSAVYGGFCLSELKLSKKETTWCKSSFFSNECHVAEMNNQNYTIIVGYLTVSCLYEPDFLTSVHKPQEAHRSLFFTEFPLRNVSWFYDAGYWFNFWTAWRENGIEAALSPPLGLGADGGTGRSAGVCAVRTREGTELGHQSLTGALCLCPKEVNAPP